VAAAPAAALAAASADRPRRVIWGAAATAAACFAVRVLLGDAPLFDARHAPGLDALRDALARPLARGIPEPEVSLALGIALGERAPAPADLVAAFNATGTTHLLAISGFNLTLVASAATIVLRRIVGPTAAIAGGLAAVLLYSAVVGLQPSVLR